jgi:hypothetical protein
MNSNDHTRKNYNEFNLEDIKNTMREMKVLQYEMDLFESNNKNTLHDNQIVLANKIIDTFKNKDIVNIIVIGKTQSGKTGSMYSTIKQRIKYIEKFEREDINNIKIDNIDTEQLISPKNIYIITGLSSLDWKEQTIKRMPESIQSNIFHRQDLTTKFLKGLINKKNIIIIMDEVQIASGEDNTICKTFTEAGFNDIDIFIKNNIKIIEFSATPDGTLYDLMKWGKSSAKIIAQPGERYIGSNELFTQNRVFQYQDLDGYDKKQNKTSEKAIKNIKYIETLIKEKYNDRPLYHIIRTNNGDGFHRTVDNFTKTLSTVHYEFTEYTEEGTFNCINTRLKNAPTIHTFIFIKEKLRCAQTLHQEHLGIMYERYTSKPDDTTIVQGLVGRLNGYNNNGISICFTNIDSIKRYEELYNSGFDRTSKYISSTVKTINGLLHSKGTYNNPKLYNINEINPVQDIEPIILTFNSQLKAKEYYKQNLKTKFKGYGPNNKQENSEGFYEATIRSKKGVYTYEQIYKDRKQGLTKDNYRFYPCYDDITDKTTLKWIFIYYE